MGILFCCSTCQSPLNVKSHLAGKRGFCPSCQEKITIPEQSEFGKTEYVELVTASKSLPTPSVSVQTGAMEQSSETDLSQSRESGELPVPAAAPVPDFVASEPGTSEEDPPNEHAMWYVRPRTGGQFGPASEALVQQWVDERRIDEDTYVWKEGWPDWALAGQALPQCRSSAALDSSGSVQIPQSVRKVTAYKRARRRRTMLGIVGLALGTIVVIGLLVVLVIVLSQQST